MPILPTRVVKFIISFLTDERASPELLLNLYKAFICYDNNSPAAAYMADIQSYIADISYPKLLQSPLYRPCPIPLSYTLTDREIMYMVDLQYIGMWSVPSRSIYDRYSEETIQEFSVCYHLIKMHPAFVWVSYSVENLNYIYALEEALVNRSKGLLYWLEINFPTFVAMATIYLYFKHSYRQNSLLLDDDFFLEFLVKTNTWDSRARRNLPHMFSDMANDGYIFKDDDSAIRFFPNLKLSKLISNQANL